MCNIPTSVSHNCIHVIKKKNQQHKESNNTFHMYKSGPVVYIQSLPNLRLMICGYIQWYIIKLSGLPAATDFQIESA